MSTISVHASGEAIEFEIEDENGERVHFRLGHRLTTALTLRALEELANLPPLEGELHQETQPPFLQGRPAFQTGVGESGDVLVAFRVSHLPTMQFLFDDELASKLACEITEITATPRDMRIQKRRH